MPIGTDVNLGIGFEFDLQAFNKQIEDLMKPLQKGITIPSPKLQKPSEANDPVRVNEKANAMILAAKKRSDDLEKSLENKKLTELRDMLAQKMKEKNAILQAAREAALNHRSRETKEAIQQIKLQTDEEINAIRKVRNAKEGSQGMSIFGIASTFMGARVGFGKSNTADLFKGGSALPGGASVSGIAASLGIGFGANELLKMGQAAAKADYQMIGAFKTAGATAAQASALVRQVTRDYETQGKQIGLTENEYKRLSQLAAFSGHFVGTQNAQLVRAAGAIEKQTAGGEGEITADRFIRAISQGVNSEEGKETFGRLRMAMPAFVKDLEQASDKEDLFQRAIQGTNETVQAQIKWLQSDDGEVERETLRRENQAERLGKLMNKWLGASINLFSKLDVIADQFFGTLDAHDSEERKIIEDKVAYLEKALSNTPKNDTAAIDAYKHAIKQLKDQLGDTEPEKKDKEAIDKINITLSATAQATQAAAAAQSKLIATFSDARDVINAAEQSYAGIYVTLRKLGNDPLVRQQLEEAMRISGLLIKQNSKDVALYNEGLTEASKKDLSQVGGGKTKEQILKEKFDKKILDTQIHYNELLALIETQATKENWSKERWDKKKLELDKEEREKEIKLYKDFGYDFSALQVKQNEDELNKEIEKNDKWIAERQKQFDKELKFRKAEYDATIKDNDAEWKAREKNAEIYQKATEERIAKENEAGGRVVEVIKSSAEKSFSSWDEEFFKPIEDRMSKTKNLFGSFALDVVRGIAKVGEGELITKLSNKIFGENGNGIMPLTQPANGSPLLQQRQDIQANSAAISITTASLVVHDMTPLNTSIQPDILKRMSEGSVIDTGLGFGNGFSLSMNQQEGGGTNPAEARRRALEEFRKEHPLDEGENGEITQGGKSLGGPVWDDILRNVHIFQSKFSLSEGVHLGHGTDHFNLHGDRGIDPFSFGSGSIAEEGGGPGLNIWGKTDLANIGTKIAKGFASGVSNFDVGKTFAKGLLSFIPGGGFLAGLFSNGGIVPEYLAGGSLINFKPRGTDTIPAMLTPGERVLSRQQNRDLTILSDRMSSSGGSQASEGLMRELISSVHAVGKVLDSQRMEVSGGALRRLSAQSYGDTIRKKMV